MQTNQKIEANMTVLLLNNVVFSTAQTKVLENPQLHLFPTVHVIFLKYFFSFFNTWISVLYNGLTYCCAVICYKVKNSAEILVVVFSVWFWNCKKFCNTLNVSIVKRYEVNRNEDNITILINHLLSYTSHLRGLWNAPFIIRL